MNNKNHLTKTTVTIDGKSYPIKGVDNEEYINMLAVMLDKRIKDVRNSNVSINIVTLLVLAALNITDEYVKIKESAQTEKEAAVGGYRAKAEALAAELADTKAKNEEAVSKQRAEYEQKIMDLVASYENERDELLHTVDNLRQQVGELLLYKDTLETALDDGIDIIE